MKTGGFKSISSGFYTKRGTANGIRTRKTAELNQIRVNALARTGWEEHCRHRKRVPAIRYNNY